MAKQEKVFVSDGMKVAGGLALQGSRGDLFDLLSDRSAMEIAVEVYEAMVRRDRADKSQMPSEAHTAKERLNHQPVNAKIRRA